MPGTSGYVNRYSPAFHPFLFNARQKKIEIPLNYLLA